MHIPLTPFQELGYYPLALAHLLSCLAFHMYNLVSPMKQETCVVYNSPISPIMPNGGLGTEGEIHNHFLASCL